MKIKEIPQTKVGVDCLCQCHHWTLAHSSFALQPPNITTCVEKTSRTPYSTFIILISSCKCHPSGPFLC